MMMNRFWRRACVPAALIFGVVAHSAALAAEMEEVVVTGSYIRGTPEDAALPVDVLSRSDLQDQGDPSINELIRNLNVSSGVIGETTANLA